MVKVLKLAGQLRSRANKVGISLFLVGLVLGLVLVTEANNKGFFNLERVTNVSTLASAKPNYKLDKTEAARLMEEATLVCPTTPDFGVIESSIQITQPNCPDADIPVSYDINNEGNVGYTGDLAITFYQGDPTQSGAIKLKTETITVTDFNAGDQTSLSTVVTGSGAPFDLYIAVNDDGFTSPPIAFPTTSIDECYYGNNVFSAAVNPLPFSITVEKIQDNGTCSVTTTGTGAAKTYVPVNGSEVVAGYTFNWYKDEILVSTGPVFTGMINGTYKVVATHDGAQCFSDTASIAIDPSPQQPVVDIQQLRLFDDCGRPNGKAEVLVYDAAGNRQPVGKYTYTWYEGNGVFVTPPISVSHVVNTLSPILYSVYVQDKKTGCDNIATIIIEQDPDLIPVPEIVVTHINDCTNPTGGLSATVDGRTQNIDFYWYIGRKEKPTPDYTDPVVTGLPAGDYTLVVIGKNSCPSDPVIVTIEDRRNYPLVNAQALAPQSSCDSNSPNGSASASVDETPIGGGASVTAGYTFEWYSGQGTTTPIIGTGSTISNLDAGTYTVKVTHNTEACEGTAEVVITESIIFPTVTATATDITQCNPPNGSVGASVGGATSGYTFYWFNGTIGTPDINNADFTGATASGVDPGDYTVVAVDNTTLCESTPEVVTVNDLTASFTINLVNLVDQTSCASPNGSISVNADGTTNGYTFRWFNGQNTLPANEITPSPGATISGLGAGVYTVLVANSTTGCENTAEYTISELLVYPTPDIVVTDQTACDPVNGALAASVGGNTTNYTFYWFNGFIGAPDIANANYTGATINNLLAGDYTLAVVDNANQCQAVEQVTIQDLTATPVISLVTQVDQTSCDPASPNGAVSITADGNTTGYTFRWFRGQNTLAANEILPSPGASITGLNAGTYTVLVRNDVTGCESTEEYTITEVTAVPVPNVTVTDQSDCAPPNGALSADVGGTTTGYSFYWFNGVVGTPAISNADYTTADVNNLIAGDYTLVVVTDATLCASVPVTVSIADNTVLPVINVLSQTDQTSCDIANPNGSISVDAGGTTTGYTFRWFTGQGTTNEITPSPGASITGLIQGVYTVLARNDATGCEATEEITIGQNIVTPVLTATPVDVTSCSPVNGSISVAVSTGVLTDYTFSWYDGVGTKATPDYTETGNTLSPLAPGDYTVEAFNNVTNCSAAPVSVTVVDATPVVTITQTDIVKPADCNALAGELEVLASASGAPSFTYEWYEGRPPYSNPSIGSGTRISGLVSGAYTVEVTNLTTGCITDSTFALPFDGAPEILIDVTNTLDNTTCDASNYNGEISVQIDPATLSAVDPGDDQNEYILNLYSGPNPIGVPTSAVSPAVFTGLAPGEYTIQAVQNFAPNCPSVPVLVTIGDDATDPVLSLLQNNPNSLCSSTTPDGALEIEIDGGALPSGYTINWYEGNDNSAPALGTNVGIVAGVNGERIEQLPAGNYHVEVLNNISLCTTSATYTVYDDQVIITIPASQIALSPQDDCNPVNGSATVNGIMEDGILVAIPSANYSLDWFDASLNPMAAPLINNQYTDLAAGTYYVQASNILTGCSSSQVPFEILEQTVVPVVTITPSQPNTSCDPANPNGILTAGVSGPLADHTFEWFIGQNDTSIPLPGANVSGVNGEIAQNLIGGYYTLRVTDNTNPGIGCQTITAGQVMDLPSEMIIAAADLTVTPQDDCSPENGSITVNAVTENGAAVAVAGGNYTFEWFDASLNLLAAPVPDNQYNGLAAGTYYVRATNTVTGCSTSQVQVEVEDQTVLPQVTLDQTQPNTSCDPANPNGVLTATVVGTLADHTFEWFIGQNDTSTPLPGANIGGANGEIAQNLGGGYYTLRVTDNTNPGLGCVTISSGQIIDMPAVLTITTPDLTVAPQDDCTPENGSIIVNAVRENDVPVAVAGGNYSFEWFDASLNTLPSPVPENQYVGLVAGTYYVRATNTVTGCSTSQVSIEVEDQTANPIVVMNLDQPNISCDPTNPQGVLSITINGSTDLTGYTVAWYIGPNNTTINLPGSQVSGNQATGLDANYYTVVVTDNNNPGLGCVTISWMEVPDDPMEMTITQADLVLSPQDACTPINGSAEVIQVRENGVPVAVAATTHSIDWYDENMNALPAPPVFNNYSGLSAGIYHVMVTNLATGCVTSQIPFEIIEQIVLPQIELVDFDNPTSCDGLDLTGSLVVNADGSTDTNNYTFAWYNGNYPVSGAPIAANNYQIGNLSAGIYTVVVTNNITGCENFQTYELVTNTNPLFADGSSSGVTSCEFVDGVLFAVVKDADGLEPSIIFNYEWYAGQGVSGSPIYTGQRVENVPIGFYTVVATAVANPACVIEIDTVEVEDWHLDDFIIQIDMVSPVTNCDALIPNGAASASVNGDIINYEFNWFNGKDLTVPPLYTGVVNTNLGVGTYTVQARNLVSGCVDSLSFEMAVEYEVVPQPEVAITNVTSCVSGNGGLHASVDGNTGGHIFNWYAGTDISGPIIFTGPDLVDLSSGDIYTVTATSRASGCESGGVTAEVGEDLKLPEYEIELGPALCKLDNGFARVITEDSLDVSSIVWSNGSTGPEVNNMPPGFYQVTVTDSLGCATVKAFEIISEINTYNGVSPNNDGRNDIFHIDCIETFPNNNVKVFNRAGTLVYEADGYNNSDVFFDGVGTRGIYFGAREVPDGTYYYVIDKRDGSDPQAGYLEVLR